MKDKLKKVYHFSGTWTGTIIIVLMFIFFIAQAFVIPSGSMKRTLLIGDFLFVKKFSYGIPIPHIPWLDLAVFPDINKNGHIYEGKSKPQRGDVVVFRYPVDPKIHYIKRMVAIGGDEIIYQHEKFYFRFNEGDEYIKANYHEDRIYTINNKLWVLDPYIEKYKGINYDEGPNIFVNMSYYERVASSAYNLAMKKANFSELETYQNFDFNAFYFKVPQGEYFMIGDNRNNSEDSRFWGSVPYKYIVGKPWFIYFSWDDNYIPRWDRIASSFNKVENNINPSYK